MVKKPGPWSEWYASGDRKFSGDYKANLRDGRWIEWDEKGKEIINGVYKKDTPWRGQFENFFYSNGKVAQEYFEYHNDGSKKDCWYFYK